MSSLTAAGRPAAVGARLLQLLRGFRVEGFERSFKMSAGRVLADRFLLGIHKSDISPPELYSVCARMGMPEKYLAALKESAEGANAFHFGFEGGDPGGICKVYLEFARGLATPRNEAPGMDPTVLLHLAFKWDVADAAKSTIARYRCFPGLSTPAVLRKIADLYSGQDEHAAIVAMREIIEIAAVRISEPPMYLEVSEEGNPRASFDVNLHEARIGIDEIGPWLSRLGERFAIPAARFDPVYAAARQATLGHLSGGISREGNDFVTVYYAADAP